MTSGLSSKKCPKCKSGKVVVIGSWSQTDHHQTNWGTTYLELKCEDCGFTWEKEE